jgi:ABC-type bacteriocin/lantibiotic exporter with double-glycine peptidase domain
MQPEAGRPSAEAATTPSQAPTTSQKVSGAGRGAGIAGGHAPGRFEVDGITVRFGGLTALDSVSLHVDPGEVLGVIGPNGAGKTTLFNVVCGFQRPDEGTLSWRGEVVKGLRPHQLSGMGSPARCRASGSSATCRSSRTS